MKTLTNLIMFFLIFSCSSKRTAHEEFVICECLKKVYFIPKELQKDIDSCINLSIVKKNITFEIRKDSLEYIWDIKGKLHLCNININQITFDTKEIETDKKDNVNNDFFKKGMLETSLKLNDSISIVIFRQNDTNKKNTFCIENKSLKSHYDYMKKKPTSQYKYFILKDKKNGNRNYIGFTYFDTEEIKAVKGF